MLRHLSLRDYVIVTSLEVDLSDGFSVLTGETGAGKSILIDALQLALGSRGDAAAVREGAGRAEITAEFDAPAGLSPWLEDAGFESGDTLLLRRVIDAQGKSRAWINGSAATVGQLREAAEHLVDIHGQHAWQGLTRPPQVRALLDAYAGVAIGPVTSAWSAWKAAIDALESARSRQASVDQERERLTWQIAEVDKLAPQPEEWAELNAEHQKLSNAQALIDAARQALSAVEGDDRGDGSHGAEVLTARAIDALEQVSEFDLALAGVAAVLRDAQAQLQDAVHTLSGYLGHTEPDPQRLQSLDDRLAAWMSLARRLRRPPAELPDWHAQWRAELREVEAASDLQSLESAVAAAKQIFDAQAAQASAARRRAGPELARAVTQAMQQLGMAGGRFEVQLVPQQTPQSHGLESAEFLVAGHEGSTPRSLAKVASGGELSRIALAIAVTTSQLGRTGTLIFDEIDAGVGGAVAETVGRLMKQLGRDRQVLAVTHLPQVAACADQHLVVSKVVQQGMVRSDIRAVAGEDRVAEVARMLGGERLSGTSVAHAEEMLLHGTRDTAPAITRPRGRRTAS